MRIKPGKDGYVICPCCWTKYRPDLAFPDKDDKRPIQKIYPDAEPHQREQLLTGLCSDRCWAVYLGRRRVY